MNDEQLLRYSRHILLPEIGIEGQDAINNARVLIVGAGGLGSPAACYLAAAGVGTLVLADGDEVDLTNLQRQILHRTDAVGEAKAISGKHTLAALNPQCEVIAITQRLEGDALAAQVALADVVLDCCDNFATRHMINRASVKHRKPLVSGAAIRFDGQITVFDAREPDAPCYDCLFPEAEAADDMRCAVTGVFAPLTGIIGSMQAAEALKLIMGCGQGFSGHRAGGKSFAGRSLSGRLLLLDAFNMTWREVRVPRDAGCAVCGTAVREL
ncbi:MAG: molybdopterin-synthase adenylyltransferase MoeB [Rugosibacter sp.]|nr:molybdopterin-synthase adenylyltransferase [Rugosibacter sp.]